MSSPLERLADHHHCMFCGGVVVADGYGIEKVNSGTMLSSYAHVLCLAAEHGWHSWRWTK